MTQYLLDSGDPDEFRALVQFAKEHNEEVFGATTNPTLISKKLAGKKVSEQEAFVLQKQLVKEILSIVPGPVSAEVYADETTTAGSMIEQGREIGMWHERIVVKLPTNLEGLEARTVLRREKIATNNTLVFSQEQIFAVSLHEQILQRESHIENLWAPFISPFVGRLDDIGVDGSELITHAMKLKLTYNFTPLILLSSVRNATHMKRGVDDNVDLITAPANVYHDWFTLEQNQRMAIDTKTQLLQPISYWEPPQELLSLQTIDDFINVIETGKLNIQHDLTVKGVARFSQDWKAIIA